MPVGPDDPGPPQGDTVDIVDEALWVLGLQRMLGSREDPRRPDERIERAEYRLCGIAQGDMTGPTSLRHRDSDDTVAQVHLIPPETKLFLSS